MKPALYSPSRYVHLLVQHLDDAAIDCEHVLRTFGVDRMLLAHPETQLQPLQALGLFRALADLDGRSDIGLLVGKRLTFGDLGETGRALLSCANLRDMLDAWAEFHPLISPSLSLQVQEHSQHLALCWVPIRPIPFDFLRVAYDMAVGGVDTLLKSVLGDRCPPYEVFFTYMAPSHQAQYGRLTRALCHFDVPGLPCLRLHIDKGVMLTPMPLSNPIELESLRKRLHQRLALTPMQSHWTAWATLMIEQANGEQPTLEGLARLIQVSAATLTRRLGSEGTNFRTLSNEIRFKQASRWLREGQWMVSDISQRLGYANLPAFVRAFKAHSGMSPTAYARQAQAQSPA
jgi:AraC-like DNA-binding protein